MCSEIPRSQHAFILKLHQKETIDDCCSSDFHSVATLLDTREHLLVMQMYHQPVTWQQHVA